MDQLRSTIEGSICTRSREPTQGPNGRYTNAPPITNVTGTLRPLQLYLCLVWCCCSISVWDITPVVLTWPLKDILRSLSYLTTPQDVDKGKLESNCQLCGHCLMVRFVLWSHSMPKSTITNCYCNEGIGRLHHMHYLPRTRGIRVSGLGLDEWCFSLPLCPAENVPPLTH